MSTSRIYSITGNLTCTYKVASACSMPHYNMDCLSLAIYSIAGDFTCHRTDQHVPAVWLLFLPWPRHCHQTGF